MIEQQVLIKAGLTAHEAQVYLACLELGTTTVLKISRQTGLKRATIYLILDSLLQKNLVKKVPKKSTTLYSAEEPKNILYRLEENLRDFKDLLPVFAAKLKRTDKPLITYYEGKETIWNITIEKIFPAESIYFSSTSIRDLLKAYPTLLQVWSKKFLPKKNIKKILELVGGEKEDLEYAQSKLNLGQIRCLPTQKRFFTDIIIADNKLYLISYKESFCICIESDDVVKSYKTLVEFAWQKAKKIKRME